MQENPAAPANVDSEFVTNLAAANGLDLPVERAAGLVPAVRAILEADAQLAALDLNALPVTGLPWDVWREK